MVQACRFQQIAATITGFTHRHGLVLQRLLQVSRGSYAIGVDFGRCGGILAGSRFERFGRAQVDIELPDGRV